MRYRNLYNPLAVSSSQLKMATNFIKNIVDKNITEDVHNVFTRYSLGEFVKEPLTVKADKNGLTIKTGFEYLNFLQRFLSEQLKGMVELSGVIETAHDLTPALTRFGLKFMRDKRFGKTGNKYLFEPQQVEVSTYKKLVKEFFGDYLLLGVAFPGGQLKIKGKNTPKLGSPTNDFCVLKLPADLIPAWNADYLFDITIPFRNVQIEQTYLIDVVDVDEKLLATEPALARKKALRLGQIVRKITVDGNVVKDYTIKFSA